MRYISQNNIRLIFSTLLVFVVSVITLNFQNCSKARFSSTADKSSGDALIEPDGTNTTIGTTPPNGTNTTIGTIPPNGDGDGSPKDPTEIISNCEDAEGNGAIHELSGTLVFDDTRVESGGAEVICRYGENGNLRQEDFTSSGNDKLVARYEQVRSLQLPSHAELCDLQVEVDTLASSGASSRSQRIYYDDVFYLSLNNVVLATNHKNSLTHLQNEAVTIGNNNTGVLIYIYDWDQLAGKDFSNNTLYDFALGFDEGLTSFSWPETQKTGEFLLSYDKEILIHAGARSGDSIHEIRFAITGDDNEKIDCYHSRFDLKLTAKYYLKTN